MNACPDRETSVSRHWTLGKPERFEASFDLFWNSWRDSCEITRLLWELQQVFNLTVWQIVIVLSCVPLGHIFIPSAPVFKQEPHSWAEWRQNEDDESSSESNGVTLENRGAEGLLNNGFVLCFNAELIEWTQSRSRSLRAALNFYTGCVRVNAGIYFKN